MENDVGLPRYWRVPIPPDVCFELWVTRGSLTKATAEMNRRGYTTVQGNKLNLISVCHSAWNYVFDHRLSTKKYFDADGLAQKKKALTDDQWAKFLVKKASKHFGKVNKQVFQSWIEACGFMKYCEIYKRSYPEAYQAHSCNI